jgi:hypothetical protein
MMAMRAKRSRRRGLAEANANIFVEDLAVRPSGDIGATNIYLKR